MYRLACFVGMLLFGLGWFTPASADEAAIRAALEAYVKAFNARDIQAVAGMWAEQATHVDRQSGTRTVGRAAIAADIAQTFKDRPETQLAGRLEQIRMIKPDVASIEGVTGIVLDGEEPVEMAFTAILVNQNGKWLIDSVEEMALPTPETPYQALSDLAWLEGHWVDASDSIRVDTHFRWSENQTFLIRSFVAQAGDQVEQKGTQVIGWDPRGRQIRSWTFRSDGSFSNEIWSKNDTDWLIKSLQTLPDGRLASGTYVLSQVDDNTLSFQLIGHEIEGEPQPTREAVKMMRAPEPAPTQP